LNFHYNIPVNPCQKREGLQNRGILPYFSVVGEQKTDIRTQVDGKEEMPDWVGDLPSGRRVRHEIKDAEA